LAPEAPSFTFQLGAANRRLGKAPITSTSPLGKSPRTKEVIAAMAAITSPVVISASTTPVVVSAPSTEVLENILSSSSSEEESADSSSSSSESPDEMDVEATQKLPMNFGLPSGEDEDDVDAAASTLATVATPVTPMPVQASLDTAMADADVFDIVAMADCHFKCVEMEAEMTERHLRQHNLHPIVRADKVLDALAQDPAMRLSLPILRSTDAYAQRGASAPLLLGLAEPQMLKLLLAQIEMATISTITATGATPYDHFPLLALLLAGAFGRSAPSRPFQRSVA